MRESVNRLASGACFGWSVGIVLGLIDAGVRIGHQHFEWFEMYLALLLPAIVFSGLFLLLALLLLSFSLVPGVSVLKERHQTVNVLFLIVAILAYGVGVLLVQKEGGGSVEDIAGPLLLLGAVIVLAAKGVLGTLIRRLQDSIATRVLKSLVVFATGFIVISLPQDLYSILRIPDQTPVVPASEETKNVVLITLDTVRADHLSLYGYKRKTSPNLDTFADNAVVFEDAISTTSWTLPSHASIFTGQRLHQHQAHTNHQVLSEEARTLAELLRERGYVTAGFVGGPYCKAKYGLAQGFQFYSDRLDFFEWNTTFDRFSVRRLLQFVTPALWDSLFQADGERTAFEINRDVFSWLGKNKEHPFFLFVNYFDAHDPYTLGDEYLASYTSERRPYEEVDRVLDDIYYGGPRRYSYEKVDHDLLQYMIALYDAEITYLDHHLNQLFLELRRSKLLENTIVIVTSDHGEEFFEHGGVLHRQTLYREVLDVPLVIASPGAEVSGRASELVGTIDIFATVLDLLEIEVPEGLPSRSLKGALSGGGVSAGEGVVSELFGNKALGGVDMRALTETQHKYIDVSTPQERVPDSLFDRENDPAELANLIEQDEALAASMSRKLSELTAQGR